MKKLRQNKKGFTLIEIIVVIVILAVLMAIAVPAVLNYLDSADDGKYMTQARGAFTAAQTEIADAYVKDGDLDAALDAAVDAIAGSTPTVTKIKAFTDKDCTSGNEYELTESPNEIACYLIIFSEGEEAKLTPNGDVTVER